MAQRRTIRVLGPSSDQSPDQSPDQSSDQSSDQSFDQSRSTWTNADPFGNVTHTFGGVRDAQAYARECLSDLEDEIERLIERGAHLQGGVDFISPFHWVGGLGHMPDEEQKKYKKLARDYAGELLTVMKARGSGDASYDELLESTRLRVLEARLLRAITEAGAIETERGGAREDDGVLRDFLHGMF